MPSGFRTKAPKQLWSTGGGRDKKIRCQVCQGQGVGLDCDAVIYRVRPDAFPTGQSAHRDIESVVLSRQSLDIP